MTAARQPTTQPSTPDAVDAGWTDEELMEACLHHAARLVSAVRSGSRTQVTGTLALTPGGRTDVLAIALASLVDEDSTLSELLAWTRYRAPRRPGPSTLAVSAAQTGRRALPREHGSERGYKQHHHLQDLPACEDCRAAHSVAQRPAVCQEEYARLRATGVPVVQAAELSRLTVVLARRSARITDANLRSA